jgi:hypothetical protein
MKVLNLKSKEKLIFLLNKNEIGKKEDIKHRENINSNDSSILVLISELQNHYKPVR